MSLTLHHVTLSTGHVRESPRREVGPGVIALLWPLLAKTLALGEQPVPGPDACTMTAAAGGDCAIATVWADDGAPLVTIGIARGEAEAARLWTLLHETAVGIEVPQAGAPPSAPWCAARLEVGIAAHPAAANWLGDFERCLAWAWVERGKPSREPPCGGRLCVAPWAERSAGHGALRRGAAAGAERSLVRMRRREVKTVVTSRLGPLAPME